ncbi:MAG: VWA domain-containing protein [Planctomycetia bacterium]|nr:VWA domain-containing protein [Planctomycetia bacterium]
MTHSLTALTPSMLWLVPLAALPIVFHLLLKRKQQRTVFSTLMFFQRVDPRLSSRRRLREWLLLAARAALIALLMLALARPLIGLPGRIPGLMDNAAVVLLVDNSASMRGGAAGVRRSKLDVALTAARAMAMSLPARTPTAVALTVADAKVGIDDAVTADRDRVLEQLAAIAPTEAAGAATAAVAAAARLALQGGRTGGVVHVFTDLQSAEWSQAATTGEALPASIRLVFHRIASESVGADVAFTTAAIRTRWPLALQPVLFRAELANSGAERAQVHLHSVDDAGRSTTRAIDLVAGGREVIDLALEPNSAGTHWVRCWVEGDGFVGNNEAAAAYVAAERASVFFLGELSRYGALPLAVAPTSDAAATALVAEAVPADGLVEALARRPVAVVATWSELAGLTDAGAALEVYVTAGGRLVVVPDADASDGDAVAGRLPAWIGATPGPVARAVLADAEITLAGPREPGIVPANTGLPFWSRLRSGGTLAWSPVRVRRVAPLEAEKPGEVAATLDDGRPVLVHRALGRGAITACGIAFDSRWTTLASAPHVVVLVHTMIAGGDDEGQDGIEIEAGAVPAASGAAAAETLAIIPAVGDIPGWSGRPADTPIIPRAAAGLVRADGATAGPNDDQKLQQWTFAVRGSAAEGVATYLDGDRVPAAGSLEHVVAPLSAADPTTSGRQLASGTADLFTPLLLLAFLAMVAEGLLGAARPPKPVVRGTAAGGPR